MRILFIVRSTLFSVRGGDTTQVTETARQLSLLGVMVDIKRTNEKIDYTGYDLLHFFNLIRPADILIHIKRSGKPFVVTPILVDYAGYDQQQRPGIAGQLFKRMPANSIEYMKTIYRAARRRDSLASPSYLWKGHRRSITEILQKTSAVLVSAEAEEEKLRTLYKVPATHTVIPNGINTDLFVPLKNINREEDLVLCVARIEGIKNQYHLIRALNNTRYRLLIIGNAAPNQREYYERCRRMAASNISFISHLPQEKLLQYYAAAKVHVLPSWFEVCGLASLEAAAMGCNIVTTANGYASSYFGDSAFYCDPASPGSIFNAIEKAAASDNNNLLRQKIISNYSWEQAATKILSAYQNILVQCP